MSLLKFESRTGLFVVLLLLVLPENASADWPANPLLNVPVSVASAAQRYPEAVPDSGGGLIVAWDDQRGGPRDIYAQRVDAFGTPRWTENGVLLCGAVNEQYEPKLVPEWAVCQGLGIEMVFGIGADKAWSSSNFLKDWGEFWASSERPR